MVRSLIAFKVDIPTILTIVVAIAWLGTWIMRLLNPQFPSGQSYDTAMLIILGYWFTTRVLKRNGDDSDQKTN